MPWFTILAVAICFVAMAALIAVAVLMRRER
jgi:heme exporter protein D